MKKRILLSAAVLGIIVIGFAAGFRPGDSGIRKGIGKMCCVQIKRNYLGTGNFLVGPSTDVINGTEVSIRGLLRDVGDEGIFVERNGTLTWIPQDVILLLEIGK